MVRQTPLFHVCVCVLLAPPSVLGVWSMAIYISVIIAFMTSPLSLSLSFFFPPLAPQLAEADAFGDEWRERTYPLNRALQPGLGPSHRNQFAESRGLPSTHRPRNPGTLVWHVAHCICAVGGRGSGPHQMTESWVNTPAYNIHSLDY